MTVSSNFSFIESSNQNRPHFETIMQDFEKSKLLANVNNRVDRFQTRIYNRDMGGRF